MPLFFSFMSSFLCLQSRQYTKMMKNVRGPLFQIKMEKEYAVVIKRLMKFPTQFCSLVIYIYLDKKFQFWVPTWAKWKFWTFLKFIFIFNIFPVNDVKILQKCGKLFFPSLKKPGSTSGNYYNIEKILHFRWELYEN